MDPNAVLSAMIVNLRDADSDAALENAIDLLEWLAKDGAKPDAFTIKLETARRHLDALTNADEDFYDDVDDDDEEDM